MKAAIKYLEELDLRFEEINQTHLHDQKVGFKGIRENFDSLFYDRQSHNEIKEALNILKQKNMPHCHCGVNKLPTIISIDSSKCTRCGLSIINK